MLDEMAKNGYNSRVTDFLMLGSPLAYASSLLEADEKDFANKQRSRELPTCPLELEQGKFSYPSDRAVYRTTPRFSPPVAGLASRFDWNVVKEELESG
jgi:hypothetical protein